MVGKPGGTWSKAVGCGAGNIVTTTVASADGKGAGCSGSSGCNNNSNNNNLVMVHGDTARAASPGKGFFNGKKIHRTY